MDAVEAFELLRRVTVLWAVIMLFKYMLFLIVAPFHKLKQVRARVRLLRTANSSEIERKKWHAYSPKVSVVIPAWNEEVGLVKTVTSILNNTYENTEIIVVNDGSEDNTHTIMNRFISDNAKWPTLWRQKQLIYESKENGGKGSALNHAICRSRGDIVVTVDADSVLSHDALSKIAEYFRDETVDAVVGNVKIANSHGLLGLMQKLEYLFGFYFKRTHSVLGAEYIYGGACAAFRKKMVFDEIGHFDVRNITEDIEMSMRTRFHGQKSVFADDVICYTEGASDIIGLIKQRLRWKRGRFEVFARYRRLFFSRSKHHNTWLSWLVLPYALLSELQLLFEPFGLALLFAYSVITGDYTSLVLGLGFIFLIYFVVGLFTEKGKNAWIIFIFPGTWLLFYMLMWVEYLALMRTIGATITGHEVRWQRWQRRGFGRKIATGINDA